MSVARRKDSRGRVLKDGEVQRKNDGLYMFRWTARNGKRHTIYDATLEGLRDKEDKIKHDLADGIRAVESNVTVNDMFTPVSYTHLDVYKRQVNDNTGFC